MTMNKKHFIILAAAALLLLLAYLVVSGYSRWSEEKEAAEEAEMLQVTDLDSDSIMKLSYTDGETEMSFTKDEDSWSYDGDSRLPLDQSVVTGAIDSYTAVSGTRRLDDAGADEDYGFDSPAYTISMKDDDGNVTRLEIGADTGEGYYMTADDGETVYTVESSIVDSMVFDEDSLIEYETFPGIYESIFHKIVVKRDGETLLEYEAEEEDDESADSDDGDADNDESPAEIYAGEVGSIYFDNCVDYYAEDDELGKYGLNRSSRKEVTVTYDDTTDTDDDKMAKVTFYMGSTVEEDDVTYVYIMLADSDMVYKVDASDMEELLAL